MPSLFRGRTIDDARTAARERLGTNAVFLEERCVRKSGWRGFVGATEYVVEADYPPPPEIDEPPQPPMPLRRDNVFARSVYDLADQVPVGARGQDIDSLKAEVRHMRALLHRLNRSTTPWRDEMTQLRRAFEESRPAPSGSARIRRLLDGSGIDGRLARSLARKLKKHADHEGRLFEAYRDMLADHIQVASWPLANSDPKLIGLVGPPGVGKTTTAAKIAARAIADFDMSVTFVAADIYRVAAIDQLARYATLLGADIEVAASANDLHNIARNAKTDLVIVDSSGRAPRGDDVAAALGTGRTDGDSETGWENRVRHVLLCLPAALRSTDADALVRRYECTAPTALAVTKIDLTRSPGGLVVGTTYADLPVSTLCTGQRVPEDISPASTGAILGYLAPDRPRGTQS